MVYYTVLKPKLVANVEYTKVREKNIEGTRQNDSVTLG